MSRVAPVLIAAMLLGWIATQPVSAASALHCDWLPADLAAELCGPSDSPGPAQPADWTECPGFDDFLPADDAATGLALRDRVRAFAECIAAGVQAGIAESAAEVEPLAEDRGCVTERQVADGMAWIFIRCLQHVEGGDGAAVSSHSEVEISISSSSW